MDPQKFSGDNSGPGDIPSSLQLEMLMTLPPSLTVRPRCKWSGCRRDALWSVSLTPLCDKGHAEEACQYHADMVEAYVKRAAQEALDDDSVTLFCRYCFVRKTGTMKEPIRSCGQ